MTTQTTGRCLCGKVQVTVSPKPLTSFSTLCCNCTNCKRRSGGIASYAFIVPKDHVSITGSTHESYSDPDTGSGKPMTRTMCTECGSPVCIIEASSPDDRCLQYGLFAGEVELPKPEIEFFGRDRVVWVAEMGKNVKETA
ncbi:unnamed protein product [Aureobasidium uvarum]|uniref:CENP-V/GFA domain-containing protein n=1 Tax=Aureobasidium uvarum TaxID=2773716 RepID=A0A9N8K7V4_9PEZI|nr:unnamed protein product [Aureobasidium uvarum]